MPDKTELGTCDAKFPADGKHPHKRNAMCTNWQPLASSVAPTAPNGNANPDREPSDAFLESRPEPDDDGAAAYEESIQLPRVLTGADIAKLAEGHHTCKPDTCGCHCGVTYDKNWDWILASHDGTHTRPKCKCKPAKEVKVADKPATPPCTCIKTGSINCKFPHPCGHCYQYHPGVSCYWHAHGKTPADKLSSGRTFERSDGSLGCGECCFGDRCDDRTHKSRDNCPYCLGSGTPAPAAQPSTRRCSTDVPHAAHTFGGRPMHYCAGVDPEWKKCPQCGRENSVQTWERFGGKCPNCQDLFDKESQPSTRVSESQLPGTEVCPTCGHVRAVGTGEYSCASCGFGMAEPCEHWKKALEKTESESESQPAELCNEVVTHLIAGASWFPCALEKGHEGGHRAAGECVRHGKYVGDEGAPPKCPHWPTCAKLPAHVQQSEAPNQSAPLPPKQPSEFFKFGLCAHSISAKDCPSCLLRLSDRLNKSLSSAQEQIRQLRQKIAEALEELDTGYLSTTRGRVIAHLKSAIKEEAPHE